MAQEGSVINITRRADCESAVHVYKAGEPRARSRGGGLSVWTRSPKTAYHPQRVVYQLIRLTY